MASKIKENLPSRSSLDLLLADLGIDDTRPKQPDEISAYDLMEKLPMGLSTAKYHLLNLYRKGKYTRRKLGKEGFVYRKAK